MKTRAFAYHCVKSVHIRSFFWSVFSCIRTEYRKIRVRKNSVFGQFLTQGLRNASFSKHFANVLNE